ncbi:aminotransferase DegT [Helicobacter sp. 16-1353]|uniref:DegT/DnrJ/EryC1/StrS family aminotransferase n=1 Tax=Helicobacter sp. 16-1353 TaxID=2004996 RepID=UPI000DCB7CEA|nr:DegT/DnrJ/EryC1/StrS family aminotransferase [Helicobacter sp. 16-1353]RAX51375.1 aminotransferase DegT [Helicobacter sp. 16-1353]
MDFINLKAQYKAYKNEIDASIAKSLTNAAFIMGESVESLESNLKNYTKAKSAISCSSGTTALVLALMALDIKNGDEVITTPFSFIATVEAILLVGAKPIFVDIDEKTYNLDPKLLENAITKNTKAIIPVSIFGQMPDMESINKIALSHNIAVIEDAAQSFGASFNLNGKSVKSCNASIIATTSFFPSKPLGCYGDGGAVFSNDEKITKKLELLRNHGQSERYKHSTIGINGRLDALQAGILNVKLKYLDSEITKRQEIAENYNKNLKNVITPYIAPGFVSAYAQYSIRAKNREKLMQKLADSKIPYAVHYPIPLHLQEVITKQYNYKKGDFKVSELVCDEIISLPFSAFLSQEEQSQIIKAVNEAN